MGFRPRLNFIIIPGTAYLGGWAIDNTNPLRIGKVTIAGVSMVIMKGNIKATAGVGGSQAVNVSIPGIAPMPGTTYSSLADALNPSGTFVVGGSANVLSIVTGYDGAGAPLGVGLCVDVPFNHVYTCSQP